MCVCVIRGAAVGLWVRVRCVPPLLLLVLAGCVALSLLWLLCCWSVAFGLVVLVVLLFCCCVALLVAVLCGWLRRVVLSLLFAAPLFCPVALSLVAPPFSPLALFFVVCPAAVVVALVVSAVCLLSCRPPPLGSLSLLCCCSALSFPPLSSVSLRVRAVLPLVCLFAVWLVFGAVAGSVVGFFCALSPRQFLLARCMTVLLTTTSAVQGPVPTKKCV